ncbi:MAG: hypothetical protein ACFCUX_09590 [Candidatus Methylacidiphilales bacterium]
MSCCFCRRVEPIPAIRERISSIVFWLAFAAFFIVYGVLIKQAADNRQAPAKKPANYGWLSR